jgi:hypothetical protein
MSASQPERRANSERRRSLVRALWHGNFARRRHAPRRSTERHAVVTDWFHPQWLAIAITILLLSCADAALTLTLIANGAVEVNPFMAPLVKGPAHVFSFWKMSLTGMGVVILTVLARLRLWGRAVGTILYVVLGGYIALVAYELFLLRNIPLH